MCPGKALPSLNLVGFNSGSGIALHTKDAVSVALLMYSLAVLVGAGIDLKRNRLVAEWAVDSKFKSCTASTREFMKIAGWKLSPSFGES